MGSDQYPNVLGHAVDLVEHPGVEFLQPPSARPYGTEAVCRDNSGNWVVLVEPADRTVTAADFA